MSFAVQVRDRSDTGVLAGRVQLEAVRWEGEMPGGPSHADVEARGAPGDLWALLDWLRYHVTVVNEHGTAVWFGTVQSVEVVTGAARVGLTLADMVNRVLVDYTYEDENGETQSGSTAWAQDDSSVNRYGRFEERAPLNDADETEAEAKRDAWLSGDARVSLPTPVLELGGGGEAFAVLTCIGFWQTLPQTFWARENGRVVHEAGWDEEHLIGWQRSAADKIGFHLNAIHDLDAGLGDLPDGTKVVVTGSASNNTTFTVRRAEEVLDTDPTSWSATTISFGADDDIMKSDGGLEQFSLNQMLKISGAAQAQNNGYAFVATEGSGRIEVRGRAANIVNEGAGANVTIAAGRRVDVAEGVTVERPAVGVTTTLTAKGVKVAQSFVAPDAWDAAEILLYARRIGSPADALRVALYSDSAGAPNASLATATLALADVGEEMVLHRFDLSPWVRLTTGSTYWIVVDRTAGGDGAWAVGLETAATYADGQLKIWHGAAWETRWTDADMPFEVWGKRDTVSQIADIVAPANCGQHFVSTLRARRLSGVYKRIWRDGRSRADQEVADLLDAGTSDNRALQAWVTKERLVVVGEEPQPTSDQMALLYDVTTGALRYGSGQVVEPGYLPLGQWVYLDGIEHTALRRVMVARAAYDAREGRLSIEAKGRSAPWEL